MLTLLLWIALGAGCTENSGERLTLDAQTAEDAGLQQDAWPGQDGAPTPDSAGQPDSSGQSDSAGQPDSASPPDSAGQPDSANSPDSAGWPDTGWPGPDSGGPDPIYLPNRYVSPSASGSGDGSQGDPWTLEQAFALAVAGDQVQVAPGMYEVPLLNTNRLPQFSPANAGTPSQRIVFFAEHPAIDAASTAQMSRIHLDGGTGPVVGSNAYVTFDGFDFKQRGAHQYTSEGSVVALWHQAIGTKISRCLFDAELQGPTGNENWGAVFIQGATEIEIADNIFRNFNVSGAGNATVIMLYDSGQYQIHHNTFENSNCPFFPKGVHQGAPDLLPASFHHNLISGATYVWQLGGVGQDTTSAGITLDIYQNVAYSSAAWVPRSYNGSSPRNFRIVNNTLVLAGNAEALIYGAGGPEPGNTVYAGAISRNNIYVSTGSSKYYQTYAATTLGELARFAHDGNLYSGVTAFFNGGTSFAGWQAAGFDPHGALGAPLFTDAAGGDFTLQPGSPAIDLGTDVLNLRGNGTGAPINAGAYILPAQSEAIGVRREN